MCRAYRPLTLVILFYGLQDAELQEYGLRILRDAQQIHPEDYHLNFNLALALRNQYDYEGAVRFYTAAVSLRPNSYTAHYNLGGTLLYQKRLDEAIAEFRKVIELNPADASAYSSLGRALGDQGKLDEAVAVFRKAIKLLPNRYTLQFDLGRVLRDQGKVDEANAATALGTEGALHAVELEPKNASVHYSTLAGYLREDGKFDEAIDAYRKAIQADPRINNDSRNQLGNLLLQQGKLDEAMAVFREAIEVHATDARAYDGLGRVLREQGKLDEAIHAFRRSIEIKPGAGTFINLGDALSRQKKPDEELDAYRKAVEVEPTFAFGHWAIGEALREQKKLDEAVLALRKSIELDPELVYGYFSLGQVLYDQKKLGESFEAFQKAVEVDPKAVAAVHARIVEMRKAQDFGEFRDREDFKRLNAAIEARGVPVVGDQNAQEGRFAEAERQYAAVVLSLPDDNGSALRLAFLRLAMEDRDGYEAVCREMLERFADSKDPIAQRRTVQVCLISNSPVGELDTLQRLAEAALAAGETGADVSLKALARRERGLAAYRAGDWQGALNWCRKSRELTDRKHWAAQNLMVEAMALYQLGNTQEARAAYDTAVGNMHELFPNALISSAQVGLTG